MKRTIWLASYPKSGNTWLRMLAANLFAKDDRPADINNLRQRGGIASARGPFDHLLLIDSGLLTPDEADCLRPRVYEELARGMPDGEFDDPADDSPVRFVKVHDAYTLTPKGEPLLAGRGGAEGAIVIVRDPRDVAPSLANHNRSSIDDAVVFMNNKETGFSLGGNLQLTQFRQQFLGWSGHIASWLDQTDIPVHLVRYEDMKANTAGALAGALVFSGIAATEAEIKRAVDFADFAQLRQQEQDKGFREAPRQQTSGPFFRRGEAGGWRDELNADQVARIEAAHAPMMLRLGYRLSSPANFARTG